MLSLSVSPWQKARTAVTLKSPPGSDNFPGLKYGRTASLILPRLYLSDFFTARDEEEMKKLGITHMVSVMEAMPTKMPQMIRHHVPIQDRWTADILQYLDGTTQFIRDALAENAENRVLVRPCHPVLHALLEHPCRCTAFKASADLLLWSVLMSLPLHQSL